MTANIIKYSPPSYEYQNVEEILQNRKHSDEYEYKQSQLSVSQYYEMCHNIVIEEIEKVKVKFEFSSGDMDLSKFKLIPNKNKTTSKVNTLSLEELKCLHYTFDEILNSDTLMLKLFEVLDTVNCGQIRYNDIGVYFSKHLEMKVNAEISDNIQQVAFKLVDWRKYNSIDFVDFKYLVYTIKMHLEVFFLFKEIDTDGNGNLDLWEFMDFIINQNMTSYVKNPFREYHNMDYGKSGTIDYTDFCRFYMAYEVIYKFEGDNGFTDNNKDVDNFYNYVKNHLVYNKEEDCDNMFKIMDSSKKGQIFRADFVNWFRLKLNSYNVNTRKLEKTIARMFREIDCDNSNYIDEFEFKVLFVKMMNFLDAFYQFVWLDTKNTGSIKISKIRKENERLKIVPDDFLHQCNERIFKSGRGSKHEDPYIFLNEYIEVYCLIKDEQEVQEMKELVKQNMKDGVWKKLKK